MQEEQQTDWIKRALIVMLTLLIFCVTKKIKCYPQ